MSFYKREDPDPEDWTPHHSDRKSYVCHEPACGEFLGSHGVKFWNGWPYCDIHHREMQWLALTPEARELERAARQDIERDDFDQFNRSRR